MNYTKPIQLDWSLVSLGDVDALLELENGNEEGGKKIKLPAG